jgi:hypothetical protein
MKLQADQTKPTHLPSHLLFCHCTDQPQKKQKRVHATARGQCKLDLTSLRTDRRAADNSTYKKLAVQWLIEALCFVSSAVVADSFRLRNRQLLVAANRCASL